MRETWREGEYGASEESITVYLTVVLKCVIFSPFVLFLAVGLGHAHTRVIFSLFLLYIETRTRSTYLLPASHIVLLVIFIISSPHASSYCGTDLIKSSLTLTFYVSPPLRKASSAYLPVPLSVS